MIFLELLSRFAIVNCCLNVSLPANNERYINFAFSPTHSIHSTQMFAYRRVPYVAICFTIPYYSQNCADEIPFLSRILSQKALCISILFRFKIFNNIMYTRLMDSMGSMGFMAPMAHTHTHTVHSLQLTDCFCSLSTT